MTIKTITIDTDQWAVVPMELLSELAESLACELDARYPACNRAYPSQERKYQSAMEPVFKSRALLLTQQPEQAQQPAPRQVPTSEWQPIETAPKKGRNLILILTPSKFPQVAYSNTWWMAGFSVECKPTHWMPLPEPPQ